MEFLEALIHLPYSQPGNDLKNCMVEIDGYVNVKDTLQNMINLMKQSLFHLESIASVIPETNTLDIYGNGELIGLCGDNDVIETLLALELVTEGEFVEDSVDTLSDSESEEE